MKLHAVARDCLFLNWAVPVASLPSPPPPLRYELAADDGVLVTVLLSRQEGAPGTLQAMLPLSHPQLQVRLCVVDEDGLPAALVRSVLVPRWLLPGAKWWVRHAAAAARFSLPDCSEMSADEACWRVDRNGDSLYLHARPGGQASDSWRGVFETLRCRTRGYVELPGGLRRLETVIPAQEPVPMHVRCETVDLVANCVQVAVTQWPQLHSAWYCPKISLCLALEMEPEVTLPRQVPAPG